VEPGRANFIFFFFPPAKKEKGNRNPTCIAHIGKAPQLVPTLRETNAPSKGLQKSATDRSELTSTIENKVIGQ